MRPTFPLMMLLAVAAPASAQDWGRARTVEVRLSSFRFTPSDIRLRAGQPVILRLTNSSSGGHDFSAPQFFAAAQISGGAVEQGEVDVPAHRTVTIRLIPARGSYRLRCTHTLHSTFGMNGRIVVS